MEQSSTSKIQRTYCFLVGDPASFPVLLPSGPVSVPPPVLDPLPLVPPLLPPLAPLPPLPPPPPPPEPWAIAAPVAITIASATIPIVFMLYPLGFIDVREKQRGHRLLSCLANGSESAPNDPYWLGAMSASSTWLGTARTGHVRAGCKE